SSQGRPPASPGWRPSREDPVNGKGARVSVAEEPSSEMPSTCRPWSPCATTQTSSGSMKSSGRPESHQSWPSPPSCESSSSSQTPSSETSDGELRLTVPHELPARSGPDVLDDARVKGDEASAAPVPH